MFKGWAILPVAQALFGKTKVEMHEIMKEWKSGTIVVCQKRNGKLHFIAGASGNYSDLGKLQECYHFGNGAQFGSWLIINEVSYSTAPNGEVLWEPKVPFNKDLNICTKAPLAVFK